MNKRYLHLLTISLAFFLCGCTINVDLSSSDNVSSEDVSSEDSSVTHVHTPGTPVEKDRVNPTCIEAGHYDLVTYCTTCEEEISRERVNVSPLGHNYGAPTYEWDNNHITCTARAVCSHNNEHVVSEVKEATFNPSNHTLEARFETSLFAEQDYVVPETPEKLSFTLNGDGHSYSVKALNSSISGYVVIPSTYNSYPVNRIEDGAFQNCMDIKEVSIPNSVITIDQDAFLRTSLKTIFIPPSVTNMPYRISYLSNSLEAYIVDPENPSFSSLDGVLFNKNMTTLLRYPYAKSGEYVIPNGVTTIALSSFQEARFLSSIVIPDSVTTIENAAFGNGAVSLIEINIPSSVTSISTNEFYAPNLLNINVDSNNTHYSSENGVLFNKDKTTLIRCPCAKTGEYSIPITVTGLANNAFRSCASLTKVYFNNGLETIGDYAFYTCRFTDPIRLPDSLTSIGREAFSSIPYVESIFIPQYVTTIGRGAFGGNLDTTIRCYASSKQPGWDDNWNYNEPSQVYWNARD